MQWLNDRDYNLPLNRCISAYGCAQEYYAQQRRAMGVKNSQHAGVIHLLLFDTVYALSPLGLPDYVVLWIIDWLPHVAHVWSELKKISLIRGVSASVKRLRAA